MPFITTSAGYVGPRGPSGIFIGPGGRSPWPMFDNALAAAGVLGSGHPVGPDYDLSLRRRGLPTPHGQHRVVGNVTAIASFAKPNGTNFVETAIGDRELIEDGGDSRLKQFTLMAVIRRDGVSSAEIISNLQTSIISSLRLTVNTSGTLTFAVDNAGQTASSLTLSSSGNTAANQWEFVAARADGLAAKVYRRNAASADFVTSTGTFALTALAWGGGAIRIGTSRSSSPTNVGGADIAAWAIGNKALTDSEITQCYVDIKQYLAALASPVLI